eukprot:2411977-Rhodomonas_salina.3
MMLLVYSKAQGVTWKRASIDWLCFVPGAPYRTSVPHIAQLMLKGRHMSYLSTGQPIAHAQDTA